MAYYTSPCTHPPPMHHPMHGQAYLSTPTPIRPQLKNTHWDYMILVLLLKHVLSSFLEPTHVLAKKNKSTLYFDRQKMCEKTSNHIFWSNFIKNWSTRKLIFFRGLTKIKYFIFFSLWGDGGCLPASFKTCRRVLETIC